MRDRQARRLMLGGDHGDLYKIYAIICISLKLWLGTEGIKHEGLMCHEDEYRVLGKIHRLP
jgi:hypothetical protein